MSGQAFSLGEAGRCHRGHNKPGLAVAWPLRQGEEQSIRQVCKNAWNSMLPMVSPTVAMVRTRDSHRNRVRVGSYQEALGEESGIGLLRLLQRPGSQIQILAHIGSGGACRPCG